MAIIKSFISAVSLYSKIPMPNLDYKEGEDRFSICFFPVIGLIILGLMELVAYLNTYFSLGSVSMAIIIALIPVIITGGIHLDGFMDVMDGVHSYAGREKRLEILEDPHIGAFCVIKLLEVAGLWMLFIIETKSRFYLLAGCGFVISRALSGIALVTFKPAKEGGMLYFTRSHSSSSCKIVLVMWAAVVYVICLCLYKIAAILPVVLSVASFFYYRYRSEKDFGGITGDIAGCFLVMTETAWLFGIFIMGLFI